MARLRTGWGTGQPQNADARKDFQRFTAENRAVWYRERKEKGPLSAEQGMIHDAEQFNIKTGVFLFGNTASRPRATVLIKRGVNGMLYLDNETATLYKWDGKEWS